jgi:hypothetical protein
MTINVAIAVNLMFETLFKLISIPRDDIPSASRWRKSRVRMEFEERFGVIVDAAITGARNPDTFPCGVSGDETRKLTFARGRLRVDREPEVGA